MLNAYRYYSIAAMSGPNLLEFIIRKYSKSGLKNCTNPVHKY